jgi:hypothetical protein
MDRSTIATLTYYSCSVLEGCIVGMGGMIRTNLLARRITESTIAVVEE